MSKAEKTREYIIEKSAELFNRKGYAGTALSDIIEATGLTKGSIYGNFENKDEVAIAVYQYNTQCMGEHFAEVLKKGASATDKLISFTNYYRENWKTVFEKGGCPIQNASIESDDHLPFLKKHIQKSIKNWAEMLAEVIEEGQKKSEFKKNINASNYAHEIILLIEGGLMLSKIQNNTKMLFTALDRIEMIIAQELKK